MNRLAVLIAAGFIISAGSVVRGKQGGSAAEGEKVFAAQKCTLCHSLAGKGNKAGPLDGVGGKLSADDIRAWLTDPVAMAKKHDATRKPPMKSYAALPKEDIAALVAYLQTVKKK